MKQLAYFAMLVAAGACGGDPPSPGADPDGAPPDIDAAVSPFAANCVACHGTTGQGAPNGPAIQHADLTVARYFVRNGDDNTWTGCGAVDRPCTTWGDQRTMPAYTTAQLSDSDLDAIVSFLAAQPKPSDGAGLYADYCEACHGPAGPIPAFKYYVKADGIVRNLAQFSTVLTTVRAGRLVGGNGVAIDPDERSRYMPAFPASALTDNEVHAIARYMCSQYPSPQPGFCANIPPDT